MNAAEKSPDFYEARYRAGYMEEWPEEKKRRVAEIVKCLGLPPSGQALDFGCGNGVFTGILKQALPAWTVSGCEISPTAVKNAAERHRDCSFFLSDRLPAGKKFDFIFTHHVLEHVFDLDQSVKEISGLSASGASMLHILPCGNEGSLEYRLCKMVKEGIDETGGGRYFFEEEGHVRRLTSGGLERAFSPHGFRTEKAFFANQFYGAVEWLTLQSPFFLWKIFDSSRAVKKSAKPRMILAKYLLLTLNFFRLPSIILDRYRKDRRLKSRLVKIIAYPPAILFKPIGLLLKKSADWEWRKRKTETNGSEMYLYLKRNDSHG